MLPGGSPAPKAAPRHGGRAAGARSRGQAAGQSGHHPQGAHPKILPAFLKSHRKQGSAFQLHPFPSHRRATAPRGRAEAAARARAELGERTPEPSTVRRGKRVAVIPAPRLPRAAREEAGEPPALCPAPAVGRLTQEEGKSQRASCLPWKSRGVPAQAVMCQLPVTWGHGDGAGPGCKVPEPRSPRPPGSRSQKPPRAPHPPSSP